MEKEELKKRLDEKVKVLKSQCKDARFAEVLIKDILSLQGQIDVRPTLAEFLSTENDETIQNKNFRITRNEFGTCVQIDGAGLALDVDNKKCQIYYKHVFEKMDTLFEKVFSTKKKIDNGEDNEENVALYKLFLDASIGMVNTPTLASMNENDTLLLVKTGDYILDRYDKMLKKAEEEKVPLEDGSALIKFREEVEFKEQLKQELDAKSKND